MPVKFEIVEIFNLQLSLEQVVVMVKGLDSSSEFHLVEHSRLDEIPIKTEIKIPRKLDENGQIVLNIYGLQLKNNADINAFKIGQVVTLFPGNDLEVLEPWEDFSEEYGQKLVAELQIEVSEKHPLYGMPVKAIAKKNDDVIFRLLGSKKYALVHLTWLGRTEFDAEFPVTKIYNHWTSIYEDVVLKDYLEY